MIELVEAATKARERAYAPYSGYRVGAALMDRDGRIWTGCNIENVSYSVTICAERVALAKMVSEGTTAPVAIAVVTKDGGTPCGVCLQALLEFVKEPESFQVLLSDEAGSVTELSFIDLFPRGFHSGEVSRTEPPSQ